MEPRSSRGILRFSDRPCKELLVVPGGATFRLDGTLNGVPSMAITARLSHKLHQTLGDDAAEDLVTWMQQVDAQRVELRELNELNFARVDARFAEARQAARADLAELRQEMGSGFAETESGFAQTESGFAAVRQEMQSGFAGSDAKLAALHEEMRVGFSDLRQEMARLEARLERRIGDLIKWSFVFWVGAVGAIAMLAGVLR